MNSKKNSNTHTHIFQISPYERVDNATFSLRAVTENCANTYIMKKLQGLKQDSSYLSYGNIVFLMSACVARLRRDSRVIPRQDIVWRESSSAEILFIFEI